MNRLGPPRRLLWALLAVLLMGIAGAWGWRGYRLSSAAAEALPVYGPVADFVLVEASGQPIGLADLKGRIWIAAFFFTNCTVICPRTMPQMARMQADLAGAEDAKLVSITVDPAHDTPAVLSAFARRLGAQPGRWHFLTGDQEAIYGLALGSFRVPVEALAAGQHQHVGDAFLHGGHFALVDRQARIRGYYDGLDDLAVSQLLEDARTLLND